jgi:hypothetical protein
VHFSDIFEKFNTLNTGMQGTDTNIIVVKWRHLLRSRACESEN